MQAHDIAMVTALALASALSPILTSSAGAAGPRTLCQMYDGPPLPREEVAYIFLPAGLQVDRLNNRPVVHPVWSASSCANGPSVLEVLPGEHDASIRESISGSHPLRFAVAAGGSYRIRVETGRHGTFGIFEPSGEPIAKPAERVAVCWAMETSGIVRMVDLDRKQFSVELADGSQKLVKLGKRKQTMVYSRIGNWSQIQPGRRVSAYEDSCTKPGYVYRVDLPDHLPPGAPL